MWLRQSDVDKLIHRECRVLSLGRVGRILLFCIFLIVPAAAQRPVRPPIEEAPSPRPTAVQLRKETFKELKKESDNLLKAAEDLRTVLDKPGSPPNSVIAEKATEIEKYAKRVQSKLKGF